MLQEFKRQSFELQSTKNHTKLVCLACLQLYSQFLITFSDNSLLACWIILQTWVFAYKMTNKLSCSRNTSKQVQKSSNNAVFITYLKMLVWSDFSRTFTTKRLTDRMTCSPSSRSSTRESSINVIRPCIRSLSTPVDASRARLSIWNSYRLKKVLVFPAHDPLV